MQPKHSLSIIQCEGYAFSYRIYIYIYNAVPLRAYTKMFSIAVPLVLQCKQLIFNSGIEFFAGFLLSFLPMPDWIY